MNTSTFRWQGGGIPVGYNYQPENKSLIPDPVFAKVVNIIFSLALDDYSALEIAQELNKRKIRSRKDREWTYKTVSYLFSPQKIEFYSGYVNNQKGNWQPLISTEMAQKLIKKHVVSESAPRPRTNKFLLPGLGIAVCGYCLGPLKSSTTQRENKSNFYYLCSNKQMKGSLYCPESKVVNQETVNDKVTESLKSQQRNLKNIQSYTASFITAEKKRAEKELKALNAEINYLLNEQSKKIDKASLAKISETIQAKMQYRNEVLTRSIIDFDFNEFAKYDLKNFYRLSIDNKRAIIKKYISEVRVFTDKIIIVYPFVVTAAGSKSLTIGI